MQMPRKIASPLVMLALSIARRDPCHGRAGRQKDGFAPETTTARHGAGPFHGCTGALLSGSRRPIAAETIGHARGKATIRCHTTPAPHGAASRRPWSGRGRRSRNRWMWLKSMEIYGLWGRRRSTERMCPSAASRMTSFTSFDSHVAARLEGQVDGRDVGRGHAQRCAVEAAFPVCGSTSSPSGPFRRPRSRWGSSPMAAARAR